MAGTKTLVTPDELLKMASQTDDRLELVDGEVLRMSPPGARHGRVSYLVAKVLGELVREQEAKIFVDTGMLLPSGNVRVPDVCLISAERIRNIGVPEGWWPEAVKLAVEVIGIEERASELDRKIEEYFAAGVQQVWRVNPETRKVAVYRSPKTVQIFDAGDELAAEDLHAGLRFPVRKLFE